MGKDTDVIDFAFNIPLAVMGHCVAEITGSAGIDQDGNVCSITLDAYSQGRTLSVHPQITPAYDVNLDGQIAGYCADYITAHCAGDIDDALNDWIEALSVREFDPETSQVFF